jgi:hypothetical protein
MFCISGPIKSPSAAAALCSRLSRRVIREDGQPLTVRTLVMQSIIQSVLTGFLGVNFWWSLIDEKKR